MIVPIPRVTDPQNGPQEKNGYWRRHRLTCTWLSLMLWWRHQANDNTNFNSTRNVWQISLTSLHLIPARAQPRSKSWGSPNIFFVRGRANSGRGRMSKLVSQNFVFALSSSYFNCRSQQKMYWFYKRYKSSRKCSRHVLKVDNYFIPESRFNMIIGTLETLIYDCLNSTSNGPQIGPQQKNGLKGWVVTRKVGGSGLPDPPVVAPLS